MTTEIPKDAPRCLRCGVRLPDHARGCPEVVQPEPPRDSLPGRDARDAFEVVS